MLKIPAGKTHLTAREAATYTERHINTIRRWIAAGTVNARRIGVRGHYTIPISELDDALKYDTSSEVTPTEISA